MLAILEEIAKLALIGAFVRFAFLFYVRRRRKAWIEPIQERRIALLAMLALGILAIKIGHEALGGDSGPFDRGILLFLHEHIPPGGTRIFHAITFSGSSEVMFTLTPIATAALCFARRRREAILLAASTVAGGLAVFLIKMVAARDRPALWDTEWYWGSSFPSGHTLGVASFAIAAALCVKRIRPRWRRPALGIAVAWIGCVGFSRLVLGVHWPTDVLAAACIGAFLPLAISVGVDLWMEGKKRSGS